MSTNLGNVQTVSDLKQRELELKAHGFDVMREAEALQLRLNVLNVEKNNVIKEVQKIYTFLESAKQQIQKQNVEQQTDSPTNDNAKQVQEKTVVDVLKDEVQRPAPVRRGNRRTRKKSNK